MSWWGAQLSHHAEAQALIGKTLAEYDGSTALERGAAACIVNLGFRPLVAGEIAVAASRVICASTESAVPVESPP